MKVYQAIAQALVSEGTEFIFGVAGVDNVDLMHEAQQLGVQVIKARHEQGAAAMADGYARVSGRPGVCTTTTGPGLTNAGTALRVARTRGSPVLLIGGDIPHPPDRHHFHRFEWDPFVECTAGKLVSLRSAAQAAEDIRLAFRHIRLGLGPAVLRAPMNIQEDEVAVNWQYAPSSTALPAPQRAQPDREIVERAASMIREASRPVIIAGRGAFASGAREEIERFADAIGALLATTIQARGLFSGNPYFIGAVGGLGSELSSEFLPEADCVVAIGSSLNVMVSGRGYHFPKARIIHIDANPARIGDATPVDLGIVGDARSVVESLAKELRNEGNPNARGFRSDKTRERIAEGWAGEKGPWEERADCIDPRHLVAEMESILPKERTVVVDGGAFMGFPITGLTVPGPDGFVVGNDFGTVGLGLPLAIGAALANPNRHCVAFVGDGGLMMTVQEIDTAVRYRIPLTVVVMNDGGFGAEVHHLRAKERPVEIALYDNPDLGDVARGFGARGMTVRSVNELPALAKEISIAGLPLVVDARINGDIMHRFMRPFARH